MNLGHFLRRMLTVIIICRLSGHYFIHFIYIIFNLSVHCFFVITSNYFLEVFRDIKKAKEYGTQNNKKCKLCIKKQNYLTILPKQNKTTRIPITQYKDQSLTTINFFNLTNLHSRPTFLSTDKKGMQKRWFTKLYGTELHLRTCTFNSVYSLDLKFFIQFLLILHCQRQLTKILFMNTIYYIIQLPQNIYILLCNIYIHYIEIKL